MCADSLTKQLFSFCQMFLTIVCELVAVSGFGRVNLVEQGQIPNIDLPGIMLYVVAFPDVVPKS